VAERDRGVHPALTYAEGQGGRILPFKAARVLDIMAPDHRPIIARSWRLAI